MENLIFNQKQDSNKLSKLEEYLYLSGETIENKDFDNEFLKSLYFDFKGEVYVLGFVALLNSHLESGENVLIRSIQTQTIKNENDLIYAISKLAVKRAILSIKEKIRVM